MKRKSAISWAVVIVLVALAWVFGPGRKPKKSAVAPVAVPVAVPDGATRD